ncbi:TorD/DmsD family molecular chaperone [Salaquimonas pukyongi]|uniref:TorD/DmsD family molecular chaperone n=1 Tax=Salaquimonas pukyongi TaxID=2712698 RepID=UPI00096B9693|nr:molecular chaperone TorD family protein [Salaquimonas pukyongi]
MSAVEKLHFVDPEDQARADLYDFLGLLLAKPADASLLNQIAALKSSPTPLGKSMDTLSRLAGVTTAETAEREYNTLFIGLGRGELLPFASYYLTGFLNEKPLAKLRGDMAGRGIARAQGKHEPEDGMASLMEMMGGMIVGRYGTVTPLEDQKQFFDAHIAPWAVHFYTDLEASKSSVFYAAVGTIGRQFMEIEEEAFRMLTR